MVKLEVLTFATCLILSCHGAITNGGTNNQVQEAEKTGLFGLLAPVGGALTVSTATVVGVGLLLVATVVLGPVILAALGASSLFGQTKSSRNGDANIPTQLYKALDKYMSQQGTDMSACLQRAVCTVVKSSAENMKDGSASTMDRVLLLAVGSPTLLNYVDGTTNTIHRATKLAQSDGDCDAEFSKCPFSFAKLLGY